MQERNDEAKRAGDLQKLEKARKWILPWRSQKQPACGYLSVSPVPLAPEL